MTGPYGPKKYSASECPTVREKSMRPVARSRQTTSPKAFFGIIMPLGDSSVERVKLAVVQIKSKSMRANKNFAARQQRKRIGRGATRIEGKSSPSPTQRQGVPVDEPRGDASAKSWKHTTRSRKLLADGVVGPSSLLTPLPK